MTTNKRISSRKSMGYLPSTNIDPTTEDKENRGSASQQLDTSVAEVRPKKSRSKSLGPGGLEVLKEDAGNKRKIAALPKSILKPTIPLSPLRAIPARRPASPAKAATPSATSRTSTPTPTSPTKRPLIFGSPSKKETSSPAKPRPASPVKQKAAPVEPSAEDVAGQERQKQKDAIQKQREARRKSMANRRVSFAPEATLHTFENLEDLQDSTTSSASTNSTRRASQMSPRSFAASTTSAGSPSTPDKQADSTTPESSPAHQRDLHQRKRRRRSSGIPPMNFNDPEDALSSSPYSTTDETTVGDVPDIAAGDDKLAIDVQASPRGLRNSTQPVRDLEDVLEEVADSPSGHASLDHHGSAVEEVGGDVIVGFQPWMQQLAASSQSATRFISSLDQENVNPFSPAFRANQVQQTIASPAQSLQGNEDMSMDITRAIGGIVRSVAPGSSTGRQSPNSRLQAAQRRRSSGNTLALGDDDDDGTMDFTTAVGVIQQQSEIGQDHSSVDDNEDLSMEFTSVFGGIQNRRRSVLPNALLATVPEATSGDDEDDEDDGGDMEMTTALGQIMPGTNEQSGRDETGAMDMTQAVGKILVSGKQDSDIDFDDVSLSAKSPPKKSPLSKSSTPSAHPLISISTTGSPALSAPRSRGRPRKSDTASTPSTPTKGTKTPPSQMTPQPTRPTTPGKTPPPNIAMRHPSPKRLFKAEIKQARSSPAVGSPALFSRNGLTGGLTPKVQLMPKIQSKRRASGIGFDKEGLGSPKVAALLDRRASISDQADIFAPQTAQSRGVRFQDPRALEAEEAREREETGRRESAQFILQAEADDSTGEDKDATMTLKDAILSMTPKKGTSKPAKGRKSLAVGSGRGLLGKRPLELDDDEEDDTPSGLKGREGSPMKRIRLQAPPSAFETTGRSFRQSLGAVSGNDRPSTPDSQSPAKKSATTPTHIGHFKDVGALPSAQKPIPVMGQPGRTAEAEVEADEEEPKVGLQDFLNMTSIRFMELNTTKRRHTIAPNKILGTTAPDVGDGQTAEKRFEDAVVAGACTLPMLELYQHSCRELKKYISEGRKIVREIETSTSEENPPLFQEYMSATPGDRSIMDNQFKNMKTHARHLSKGMWYEWRMKLLEGLREVLIGEAEGLMGDNEAMAEQERILQESLPSLLDQHQQLHEEYTGLQQRASDLADCDQDDLAQTRQQLITAHQDIRTKRDRLAVLQQESKRVDTSLEDAQDAKVEHLQAIQEAQRVREQYRGWSTSEVNTIKEQVTALELEHDWAITSAAGSRLTMVHRNQLEIFFDVAAFGPSASKGSHNARISLSYTADQNVHKPQPLTTEKRFFLQLLRAHLHSLTQHETTVRDLLEFISASWAQCLALAEEVHRLDLERITHCDILSDERLAVKSMLLIPSVATKVYITFEIGAAAKASTVEVKLNARAEVAYGEQYREDKMRDFLKTRIGEGMSAGKSTWADAVRELGKKLTQRGKK